MLVVNFTNRSRRKRTITAVMDCSLPMMNRITLLSCLVMIGTSAAYGVGESISLLTPGTAVDVSGDAVSSQSRWNHVVLVAKPRLASGATNKIGETIRRAVSTLSLTILATVNRDDNGTYRLAETGVGYSVPIRGKQTVISSQTAAELGAGLSLITRHVLSENEKRLSKVCVIARSSTLIIFDTPAIIFRGEKHRDYTIRHLCWIDPATGNGATLVWILGEDSKGRMRVVDEPMRCVAAGTIEDRGIHVDGSEFMLGIPTERAFALESLPPGVSISWPTEDGEESIASLASRASYDERQLSDLTTRLSRAIATAIASANVKPDDSPQ